MEDIKILKTAVSKFYSHNRSKSSNRNKIKSVTEQKIRSIQESEANAWFNFYKSVSNKYKKNRLRDISYIQFPCYILQLKLEEKRFKYGKRCLLLNVNVSLLSDYYTIFVIEEYTFTGIKVIQEEKSVIQYWKSFRWLDEPQKEDALRIIGLLEKEFPNYRQISHTILLNYRVKKRITPVSENNDQETINNYSLYQLLFDNVTPLSNVIVLK